MLWLSLDVAYCVCLGDDSLAAVFMEMVLKLAKLCFEKADAVLQVDDVQVLWLWKIRRNIGSRRQTRSLAAGLLPRGRRRGKRHVSMAEPHGDQK